MRVFIHLAIIMQLWNVVEIAAFTSLSSPSRPLSYSHKVEPLQMVTSGIPNWQDSLTREKLIQKAKEIDPKLENETSGSYADVTWSNRLGTVITPVSMPGVYGACRPFYWNKIDVGGRMAIIELSTSSDGSKPDLFIHSPVNLGKSQYEPYNTQF